jgi:hypothetical protein
MEKIGIKEVFDANPLPSVWRIRSLFVVPRNRNSMGIGRGSCTMPKVYAS